MSKAMAVKKKATSSSETSSGSTSGSSSSSSSSSGSDSTSSSESDSSSSQESTKSKSNTEPKKCAPVPKGAKRNSDGAKSVLAKSDPKPVGKVTNSKAKPPPSKTNKTTKIEISSTDDDDTVQSKACTKKKSTVKPKNSATVTPKTTAKTAISKTISSVTKTVANKSQNSKVSPSVKVPIKGKEPVKTSRQIKQKNAQDDNKKKSIFSPENSSESDHDKQVKVSPKVSAKPRPKAQPKAVEKPKNVVKKVEKEPDEKIEVSSASSEYTTSTDTSSSSDSDSSASQSDENKKTNKKPVQKAKATAKRAQSDSENDGSENIKQVVRKSTRSANTRKSKHVLGKNIFSDTDSDTESTKRSSSRSPVKRPGTAATKGKNKNKRPDAKNRAAEITIKEERKCPMDGCDSNGHLNGKLDRHFILEACPLYHNMTFDKCKEEAVERKKREDNRKKALEIFKKIHKTQPTTEQKQYVNRIRDLRGKFKTEMGDEVKPIVDKTREPALTNFVSDYDLKLFRDAQAASSEKIEDDLKQLPNTRGTKYIEMGKYEMEVWYQSPYPDDYSRLPKLYICEFCLRYMKSHTILQRHSIKCVWKHPPGEEVYRKDRISVWEVDGKRYKQYCQNLCLLAKFFLDHKTLYYDVEPFLFYVMTMFDSDGCHTVGYFSKEKNSFLNYNVSCILTLPPYQRQGYGRLLIDFSYLLTRVEGKIGSPEKPLSDLGLISYRSYWKDVLLSYLCATSGSTLSVKDISQEMAIHSYDIVSTLQALGMMKYWKGKHIVLKKQDVLDEYVDRTKRRGPLLKEVDPTCLRWNPPQPQQLV